MAGKQGWNVFLGLFLGVLGASIFWLYSPFLKGRTGTSLAVEASKEGLSLKEAAGRQALGSRFQMVTDGKQVFLADLKEGRVWRYFHVTLGSREQEGFLSLPMFYEGKTYYSAAEARESKPAIEEEKKPQ